MADASTQMQVDYFDGHSARAHRVRIWIEQGMLQLAGRELIRQIPLEQVQWPERTRQGIRMAHFADGGTIQALDASHWDAWYRSQGLGESLVVRAQQSWRWSMMAAALLVLVTAMGYWWGLPLAARAIAPLIPAAVDAQVGQSTLKAMDGPWLQPSKLPPAEQARWRSAFQSAAERHARASGESLHVPLQWHFRKGAIGPNAFALPDGSIVVTDELIELLADRPEALLGVIGHELGHVALRHGMRTLIQSSLLGAATSVALGDFSGVLAGAPALLGHLAYARDHEREADEAAIAFMRHNGIRPSSMVVLFERLQTYRQKELADARKTPGKAPAPQGGASSDIPQAPASPAPADLFGIAFSSHPPDAERIARFKAADTPE